MLQDFFKHKKARTIHDGRQIRVFDDGNGGASGSFEAQRHSWMNLTQQYALIGSDYECLQACILRNGGVVGFMIYLVIGNARGV